MLPRIVALLAVVALGLARPALAACPDAIARFGSFIPAAFRLATDTVPQGSVRITFVGHATFLIESPEGVKAITDYTDLVPIPVLPDIITMNHFHITHYSNTPDSRIPNVLRGWNPGGGIARNDIKVKDMRVRNIQTNFGEFGELSQNENSIFVFEVANMCLAHLSHTHHILTKAELTELGDIDVLFVPVDGMFTLSEEEVFDSIDKVKPKLVIPWHYSYWTPQFVAHAEKLYPVRRAGTTTMTVSKDSLPKATEVVFLNEIYAIRGFGGYPGGFPGGPGFGRPGGGAP